MSFALFRDTIAAEFSAVVNRVVYGSWQSEPAQPADSLTQEIHHLEQSLAEIATRPSRAIRPPQPLTEQQKIIDLAG